MELKQEFETIWKIYESAPYRAKLVKTPSLPAIKLQYKIPGFQINCFLHCVQQSNINKMIISLHMYHTQTAQIISEDSTCAGVEAILKYIPSI